MYLFLLLLVSCIILITEKKYRLQSGKTDTVKLQHDLLRLLTSLGIAEVVYNIVRWISQYYLLSVDYDPYLASIASQVVSMIVYLIAINLSMKMIRSRKHTSHYAEKIGHRDIERGY